MCIQKDGKTFVRSFYVDGKLTGWEHKYYILKEFPDKMHYVDDEEEGSHKVYDVNLGSPSRLIAGGVNVERRFGIPHHELKFGIRDHESDLG